MAGAQLSPLCPGEGGEEGNTQCTGQILTFCIVAGRLSLGSVVRAQMGRGRGKEGEKTQERGELEEQLLEPRAIKSRLRQRNGRAGQDCGSQVEKVGCVEAPCVPDLQGCGRGTGWRCVAPRLPQEQPFKRPGEDEIKMPGT